MSGLKAALYKDLKLFFRKTGLAVLLLPLALLLALQFGLEGGGWQPYVQPFPIAVRDEDDTLMSRSLTSQMSRVRLFSQMIRPENGETDAQLLEQGAAAVVTIPKDFFYDLYSMEDCPVQVTLNEAMPLQSSLFRSMFCSVMEIVHANQGAWRGLYTFCYGELTPEQQGELYAEASGSLIRDALGRLTMFDDDEKAEVAGMVERKLLAVLLAVIVLFFSLSTVKTLPEELTLGVLPRFRAAGGSLPAFLCAKLLTALLAVFPTLLLTVLLLRAESTGTLLLVGLILLVGAFGFLLAVAAWSGSSAAAQRSGNLLLLLSLVLGGGLWPRGLLPEPLAFLGRWTLPHYGLLGVEAACRGSSAAGILRLLWPVLLIGAAGFALALPGLRWRVAGQAPSLSDAAEEFPDPPLTGVSSRLIGMADVKLRAMSGGLGGLALLLAGALLCGAAAASAQNGGVDHLRIAICDLDGTASSRELVELLSRQEELSVTVCGAEKGQILLLQGDVEGVFTIVRGYEDALQDDTGEPEPTLRYTEANSAISAQGVREIAAGQATVQRCRLRAIRLAGQRLGAPLDDRETDQLLDCISQAESDAPLPYNVLTADGAPLPDPFLPSPIGFAALCVLFTLFTAAPWSGAEGRRAARRLLSLPYGRLLACGSDCLALSALGFLTALAVLLPCGAFTALPAAAVYAFCAAALAQALTRFTAMEGRVDGFAPFLALFLCLLGGCFLDLSQVLPAFRGLALLTPPGLAMRAAAGFWPAYVILLAQGALFLRIASPGRKRT